METIGERVKRARMARALTQAELAESAGIEEATISRIESNKSTPRQSTIKKLALVLQADPGWLLIGDGVDLGKLAA